MPTWRIIRGMSLVALDNVLHERIMQTRFHAEPGITASDLVLQERNIRFVEAPPLDETDIPVSQGMEEAPEVAREPWKVRIHPLR